MKKELLMAKLRKGSLVIAVICAIAVICDLYGAGWAAFICLSEGSGMHSSTQFQAVEICTAFLIIAGTVLAAGLMFFRIAKNGIPFTKQNVRTLRIIGILFLLRSILPRLTGMLISGYDAFRISYPNLSAFDITDAYPIIEGLLFLFIAYFVRYGAMLQQESDETL